MRLPHLFLSAALVLCCVTGSPGAVRGKEAMYVGGTLTVVPEKSEGNLDVSGAENLVFTAKQGSLTIPYKGITSLEYGQKAGRRVGVALAVSPVALFSKKRKHYVSLTFNDEKGAKQGAVFELSKGTVQSIVSTIESKSGKKVEFESEEAKKHFEKEAK